MFSGEVLFCAYAAFIKYKTFVRLPRFLSLEAVVHVVQAF